MFKRLFLLLVLLIVGALGAAYFYLGSILSDEVKTYVTTELPKTTETTVDVKYATVAPFRGSAKLEVLSVGNPQGYNQDEVAMSFEAINVGMKPFSALTDRVVLTHVHLENPVFNFQQTIRGNNFSQLMRNIEKNSADDQPKIYVVQELKVMGGTVNLTTPFGSRTVDLPPIDVQDLSEEGVTAERVIAQIIGEMLPTILSEIASSAGGILQNPGGFLDALGGGKEAPENPEKGIDESLGNLFGN